MSKALIDWRLLVKLLVYIKKKMINGPKIDPCGAPAIQVGRFILSSYKYTQKLFTIQLQNYEKQFKNPW